MTESDASALACPEARVEALEKKCAALAARCGALEARVSHFYRLHVASLRLGQATDADEVKKALREILADVVGSEEIGVLTWDAARQEFRPFDWSGKAAPDAESLKTSRGGTLWALLQQGDLHVFDSQTTPREWDSPAALVSLKAGPHIAGALWVYGLLPQKEKLEEFDKDVLRLVGFQAGAALRLFSA